MKEILSEPSTMPPEQQKQLVDDAIEGLDRHAESQLEMARLFLGRGEIEIVRRRLQEVVELYGRSDSAMEAKKLLEGP